MSGICLLQRQWRPARATVLGKREATTVPRYVIRVEIVTSGLRVSSDDLILLSASFGILGAELRFLERDPRTQKVSDLVSETRNQGRQARCLIVCKSLIIQKYRGRDSNPHERKPTGF